MFRVLARSQHGEFSWACRVFYSRSMNRLSPPLLLALTITVLACGAGASTAPTGLHGTYHLRSVNGLAVPLADPACCGATLDSGTIQVRTDDTIQVRRITSTAPMNGLPGTEFIAIGVYFLRPAGGGFALEPGSSTNVTPPVDTLYVIGDTLLVVEGTPRWQQGIRSRWRYTP